MCIRDRVSTTDGASPTPNEDKQRSLTKETSQFFLLETENNLGYNTTSNVLNGISVTARLGEAEDRKIALKLNADNSVQPILCELRRYSILRASGHTFEYLGFGPGNYSTAFPSKQNRDVNPTEQRLAQSFKQEGGVNFFTGMNDKGISYTGNKKVSTITGKEEIVDTPVQTVTGEDIANLPELNVSDATEFTVKRSLKVEGGDDNKITSEFNGPLLVNNKVTVSSDKGLEANAVYLQGDTTVSRKYTVGLGTPTLAANPGDVSYYANPVQGGYAGWVYTSENDWKRFGTVSYTHLTLPTICSV